MRLYRSVLLFVFIVLSSIFVLTGCKSSEESSVTPTTTSTGSVTIRSQAIGTTASLASLIGPNAALAPVTDFKFCITKIKMVDGSGAPVADSSGATSISAILGLVDVSAGTAVDWGTLDIPVGFTLGELALEIHKDAENCPGSTYSLSYNGILLNQDLEFKFTFNPAITLGNNDVLGVSLDNIIGVIQTAEAAGALNDEGITAYIEQMSGSGSEEVDGDAL